MALAAVVAGACACACAGSAEARAEPAQCRAFAAASRLRAQLTTLGELPEAQGMLLELEADLQLPALNWLRRTIEVALAHPDLTVANLTQELRERLGHPQAEAFAFARGLAFADMESSRSTPTPNQRLREALLDGARQLWPGSAIAAPDARPFAGHRHMAELRLWPLSVLAHEMAHLRLWATLSRLAPRLLWIWPPSLFRLRPDGEYEVHPQLIGFLHEWYATTVEWRTIFAYADAVDFMIPPELTVQDSVDLHGVQRSYRFTRSSIEARAREMTLADDVDDPEVLAFVGGRSFGEILSGRGRGAP